MNIKVEVMILGLLLIGVEISAKSKGISYFNVSKKLLHFQQEN